MGEGRLRTEALWVVARGHQELSCDLGSHPVEDDWIRIRPATAAYAVLGIFQFVAVARYHAAIDWSGPGWIYIGILASVLLAGVYGWIVSGRYAKAELRT